MKPRSIISLIIAAVLVLAGIITCAVASAKAKSEGIMLFPEADAENNLVYRMDLTGTTKVTVDCADADITVIGGAEKSSIEVVNFNANYYKLSFSNGSVNFGQVDDFLSMFKFWDNGFSFKGMRYILRFGDDVAGEKKVIVKLADSDAVSLVHLSTETGTITLEDLAYNADYTLKSTSGKINASGVTGASSMSISGESPELVIDSCQIRQLTINGEAPVATISKVSSTDFTAVITGGEISISDSTLGKLAVTSDSGAVKLASVACTEGAIKTESGKVTVDFNTTDSLAVNVSTASGRISVDGEFKESFSINTPSPQSRLNINTASGDVFITEPKE